MLGLAQHASICLHTVEQRRFLGGTELMTASSVVLAPRAIVLQCTASPLRVQLHVCVKTHRAVDAQ